MLSLKQFIKTKKFLNANIDEAYGDLENESTSINDRLSKKRKCDSKSQVLNKLQNEEKDEGRKSEDSNLAEVNVNDKNQIGLKQVVEVLDK